MADGDSVPGRTQSPGSRIAVIDKAVKVLDAVLAARDGLTPTEVGESLKTNRSTAFRLLVSLEYAGLLSRDPTTGRYSLGMKMLQYGSAVRNGMDIIEISEPVMMKLRDETRQTTLLVVREGWNARCLMRLPGLEVDVLFWTTGNVLGLHGDAAAQAILSALDEAEVDQFFSQSTEWLTRIGDQTEEDLKLHLAQTRDRGWALNSATTPPGLVSLGTVVRDPRSSVVYAISVSGLERHYLGTELDRIAANVKAAASDIAQQLSE